jgi:isocitrate dehydrogenase (NAD+)
MKIWTSRYENLDLVIFRENTEDLYAGIEYQKDSEGARAIIDLVKKLSDRSIRPDSGISIKPISVYGTTGLNVLSAPPLNMHRRTHDAR